MLPSYNEMVKLYMEVYRLNIPRYSIMRLACILCDKMVYFKYFCEINNYNDVKIVQYNETEPGVHL